MSLFDLFSTPKQAASAPETPAAPAATPVQPGNLPSTEPAPVVSATPAPANPQPQEPASPLDEYKTLWENVPNANDESANSSQALDPVKLQELVSKANFSQQINPETLAKITAGGEDAATAFSEALNSVAQQVMIQSTLASDKLMAQKIQEAVSKSNAQIPELIRKQTLNSSLKEANPIFNNPAVRPVIEAVQSQLAAKHPEATPAELAQMAQNFVTVMGEAFSPKPAASSPESPQDWDKFINGQ